MRLNPPKVYTWTVGLVLLVLGILGFEGIIGVFEETASFYLEAGGLGLLLLATLAKGL